MSIQSSINSAISSIAGSKFLKEVGSAAIQSKEEAEQRVKQHPLAGQTLEDFLNASDSANYSLEQSVAQMQPYQLSETGPKSNRVPPGFARMAERERVQREQRRAMGMSTERSNRALRNATTVTAEEASESADQSMQDAQFAKQRKGGRKAQLRAQAQESGVLAPTQPKEEK